MSVVMAAAWICILVDREPPCSHRSTRLSTVGSDPRPTRPSRPVTAPRPSHSTILALLATAADTSRELTKARESTRSDSNGSMLFRAFGRGLHRGHRSVDSSPIWQTAADLVSSQTRTIGPCGVNPERRTVDSTLSIKSKLALTPGPGLRSHRHRRHKPVRSVSPAPGTHAGAHHAARHRNPLPDDQP